MSETRTIQRRELTTVLPLDEVKSFLEVTHDQDDAQITMLIEAGYQKVVTALKGRDPFLYYSDDSLADYRISQAREAILQSVREDYLGTVPSRSPGAPSPYMQAVRDLQSTFARTRSVDFVVRPVIVVSETQPEEGEITIGMAWFKPSTGQYEILTAISLDPYTPTYTAITAEAIVPTEAIQRIAGEEITEHNESDTAHQDIRDLIGSGVVGDIYAIQGYTASDIAAGMDEDDEQIDFSMVFSQAGTFGTDTGGTVSINQLGPTTDANVLLFLSVQVDFSSLRYVPTAGGAIVNYGTPTLQGSVFYRGKTFWIYELDNTDVAGEVRFTTTAIYTTPPASWAERGNTSAIPDNKIPASIARDSEIPDITGKQDTLPDLGEGQVWQGDADGNPVAATPMASTPGTGSTEATWARAGNTDTIPEDKIPDSIARDSEIIDELEASLLKESFHADGTLPATRNGSLPAIDEGSIGIPRTLTVEVPLGQLTNTQATDLNHAVSKTLTVVYRISDQRGSGFYPEYKLEFISKKPTSLSDSTIKTTVFGSQDINPGVDTYTVFANWRQSLFNANSPLLISENLFIRVTAIWRQPTTLAVSLNIVNATFADQGRLYDDVKALVDAGDREERTYTNTTAQSLQEQISALRLGLITDEQRRKLALFDLIQETSYSPFAVAVRSGSTGAFTDPAVTTYTPTSRTIQIQTLVRTHQDQLDFESKTLVRQGGNDYRLSNVVQTATGTNGTLFIYSLTLPNTSAVTFWQINNEDSLRIIKQVEDLITSIAEVQQVLNPGVKDALSRMSVGSTSVTTTTRTDLVPKLTVERKALSGSASPFSTPALNGGEYIVGVSVPQDRQATLTNPITVIEGYLNNATRLPLVQINRAPNGYLGYEVPVLVPAQPAHTENSRVYLRLRGRSENEFDLLTNNPVSHTAESNEFLFPLPAGVTQGTNVTVHTQQFLNDVGTTQAYTDTVQVGGTSDGADVSHDFTTGGSLPGVPETTLGTLSSRYHLVHGQRYIRVRYQATAGHVALHSFIRVSVYYTTTTAIPAAPERYDYYAVYSGTSFHETRAAIGIRVDAGNLVFVVQGDDNIESGIPASRFGLEANGNGVLRITTTGYKDVIAVTAGDLTSDDMDLINHQVSQGAYALGFFVQGSASERFVEISTAIKAQDYLDAEGNPLSTGGSSGGGLSGAAVDTKIATHNTKNDAHQDIRNLIPGDASESQKGVVQGVSQSQAIADSGTTVFGWTVNRIRNLLGAALPEYESAVASGIGTSTSSARGIWTPRRLRSAIEALVPAVFRTGNTARIPADKLRVFTTYDATATYTAGDTVILTQAQYDAITTKVTGVIYYTT